MKSNVKFFELNYGRIKAVKRVLVGSEKEYYFVLKDNTEIPTCMQSLYAQMQMLKEEVKEPVAI